VHFRQFKNSYVIVGDGEGKNEGRNGKAVKIAIWQFAHCCKKIDAANVAF